MSDPYSILGVSKSASQDEIKSAYRKLAKKYHPDLNQGSDSVEKRFKEVSAAYDILGDPDKRKRYDRGEIDPEGKSRAGAGAGASSGFWRWGRRGREQQRTRFDFGPEFDDDVDPFEEVMKAWRRGQPGGATGPGGQERGDSETDAKTKDPRKSPQDLRYRLKVPFLEAVNGVRKRVTLSDGRMVDLSIPVACVDGQTLRLKGEGKPAKSGRPAGDAYIELQVRPHRVLRTGRHGHPPRPSHHH